MKRATRNESRLRLRAGRKHEKLTSDQGREKTERMQGERIVSGAQVTPECCF